MTIWLTDNIIAPGSSGIWGILLLVSTIIISISQFSAITFKTWFYSFQLLTDLLNDMSEIDNPAYVVKWDANFFFITPNDLMPYTSIYELNC